MPVRLVCGSPWPRLEHVTDDVHGQRRCDLCGEVIEGAGYGSGRIADGLYCSLRCFALKDDRYVPPVRDMLKDEGQDDDHES